MNKRLFSAIAWGIAASAIAFWTNRLMDRAFTDLEPWRLMLLAALMEETAKLLAIRNSRQYSLATPLAFLVAETAVQVFSPLVTRPVEAWFLTSLLGVVALRQLLFYLPVYLGGYSLWSLPLATGLHYAWNWYADAPKGADVLPLTVVVLAVVVLAPAALFKWSKTVE